MSKAYYSKCPCKNCPHRKISCHSTCSAYTAWKEDSVEIKEPFIEPKAPKKRTQKR